MNNYKQIKNSIIYLSNIDGMGINFFYNANSCRIGAADIIFKEGEKEPNGRIEIRYHLGYDSKMKKHDNGNFFYHKNMFNGTYLKDYVTILLPYNTTLDDILTWVGIINKEAGCYPQYSKDNLNAYIGTTNAYDNSSNGMYDYYAIRSEIADTGRWNGVDYEFDVCNLKLYDHAKRMEICVPIAVYEKIDLAIQNMLIKHRIGFTLRYVEISLALNTTMQEISDLLVAFDEIADKDLKYRLLGKKQHLYKTQS